MAPLGKYGEYVVGFAGAGEVEIFYIGTRCFHMLECNCDACPLVQVKDWTRVD